MKNKQQTKTHSKETVGLEITSKRNAEAPSCNHYCRVKATIITYSECVSVALVKPHAPYYIVICGLSALRYFFHIISQIPPTVPTSAAGISHVVADVEAPGGEKWEHLKSGGKQ